MKNCLSINLSKSQATIKTPLSTKVISTTNVNIKLKFSKIAISNYIDCLGILIDSKLLFRNQTDNVQNKLSQAVSIMSKLKNFFPPCI